MASVCLPSGKQINARMCACVCARRCFDRRFIGVSTTPTLSMCVTFFFFNNVIFVMSQVLTTVSKTVAKPLIKTCGSTDTDVPLFVFFFFLIIIFCRYRINHNSRTIHEEKSRRDPSAPNTPSPDERKCRFVTMQIQF